MQFHIIVATCPLWPPVHCGHLSIVATCPLWPPVHCGHLPIVPIVATRPLWPPVRVDHLSVCHLVHGGPRNNQHCRAMPNVWTNLYQLANTFHYSFMYIGTCAFLNINTVHKMTHTIGGSVLLYISLLRDLNRQWFDSNISDVLDREHNSQTGNRSMSLGCLTVTFTGLQATFKTEIPPTPSHCISFSELFTHQIIYKGKWRSKYILAGWTKMAFTIVTYSVNWDLFLEMSQLTSHNYNSGLFTGNEDNSYNLKAQMCVMCNNRNVTPSFLSNSFLGVHWVRIKILEHLMQL